jgi:hypothetical protein
MNYTAETARNNSCARPNGSMSGRRLDPEKNRWGARQDWRRTTLAPDQAVCVLRPAAVAARNQPHTYATQIGLFSQFTPKL